MILIRDYPNGDRSRMVTEDLIVFDYLGKPYGFNNIFYKLSGDYVDPWYIHIPPNESIKFNTHRMMYAVN